MALVLPYQVFSSPGTNTDKMVKKLLKRIELKSECGRSVTVPRREERIMRILGTFGGKNPPWGI